MLLMEFLALIGRISPSNPAGPLKMAYTPRTHTHMHTHTSRY